MKCQYCGAEMRDDAVLCTSCGRLTAEYERTYRRPDPTIGAGGRSRSSYDPDISARRGSGNARPRLLLALVIAAIVAIGVLSAALGYILPEETGESYREVIEEEREERLFDGEEHAYDELLSRYFEAYSANDEDAIRAMFPRAICNDPIDELDGWAFGYGDEVADYGVVDELAYSEENAAEVSEVLNENVEQYLDVVVTVYFADDEDYGYTFDCEVVQIDGSWYFYEIW